MNSNYYSVIMAGGIGSRFWPMSKSDHPKQFIDIVGDGETLIRKTYKRFLHICPPENIFIVTNEAYKGLLISQIPELQESRIICEPGRRNTAPCIAYANHKIQEINPDAVIIVAPSDHIISNEDVFTEAILSALKAAEKNNWLITLGIHPDRPETGYGYIQFDDADYYPEDTRLKKVKLFTEKPTYEIALSFIQSGDFLWNAGIFIWTLKNIQKAFENFLPEINDLFREGIGKYNTPEEEEFIRQAYAVCRNISIDYGIMEKAKNVYVLCSEFGWSDLGTWGSLYETRPKDKNMNAVVGNNVMTYNSKNCIINVPQDKLVVVQGLDNYIVVEHDNILLICKKTDEQQIRDFVNNVKMEKGDKFV